MSSTNSAFQPKLSFGTIHWQLLRSIDLENNEMLKTIRGRIRHSLYSAIIQFNQTNNILVLGDGRSGTTWLAQILNFDGAYLDSFEPFHGIRNLKLSDGRLYPTANDVRQPAGLKFENYVDRVVLGKDTHRLSESLLPLKGVIIKDISCHLLFDSLKDYRMKKILIVRNPISVALSKMHWGIWHSTKELKLFLQRTAYPHELINTPFLEYIFVWCVLNKEVLRFYPDGHFTLVYYEHLLRRPELQCYKLFHECGLGKRHESSSKQILKAVKSRSKTTQSKNQISKTARLDMPWKDKVETEQLRRAYQLLRDFGMYEIYEDSVTPKMPNGQLCSLISSWSGSAKSHNPIAIGRST